GRLTRNLIYSTKPEIDCTQENRDIFFMESLSANGLRKTSFMVVCTKNSEMNYKTCQNYKQID
ncbi:hypothetical protein N5I69_24010, partial [Klebsiella pneumoniae]|nr:hypothetical protein [Klebsiella pneumoniae]